MKNTLLCFKSIFSQFFSGGSIPKGHASYRVKAKEGLEPYFTPRPDYVYIRSPMDVYNSVNIEHEDRETFVALYLNAKNRVIKKDIVSRGPLSANIVHLREVYKEAVLSSAASVIVSHNYPSGDPTPSSEDLEITERLIGQGRL